MVYESERARDLCTRRRAAQRLFGESGAKRLARRVKELESADSIADLLSGPGAWHRLHGDRHGTYAAKVTGPARLIVWFSEEPEAVVITVGNEYH